MKTAREMFEELGYIQDLNNDFNIGYIKHIKGTASKNRMITFMKDFKYFTFIDQDNNVVIDMKELKAINKQVEELWGEE